MENGNKAARELMSRAMSLSGKGARAVAGGVCRTACGMAVGTGAMALDLVHATPFANKRIQRRVEKLARREMELRAIDQQRLTRYDYPASIVISGDLLANYLAGAAPVPGELNRAYELAYPDLAQNATFVEHARTLEDHQLTGFISGVKGKLFELQYVDHLNSGLLEPGYHAVLAESPTQAGWDIQVFGPDNDVAGLLQLKATQYASYARQAIDQYPGVDVVIPKEMAAHLEVIGLVEALQNKTGGDLILAPISEASLGAMIERHAIESESALGVIDGIPVITLALCGLQGLRAPEGVGWKTFGEKAAPRCLLFQTAVAVSPLLTPLGGIVVVIGANYAIARGRKNREVIARLDLLVRKHNAILRHRRRLHPPMFYNLRRWWEGLQRRWRSA